LISGYIEVYIPKHVPSLIFEDSLKLGSHLPSIHSASFPIQIIYNILYQSPLFQYKLDVCHAPLCCAQRDPLRIRPWICLSLLANGVEKGWKKGEIYSGLSVN